MELKQISIYYNHIEVNKFIKSNPDYKILDIKITHGPEGPVFMIIYSNNGLDD